MRSFLRKLLFFLLGGLCLWAIVVWAYARQRPFDMEVGAITNDKQELLQRQEPPRIILVGGSNLNFGIDSPEIERRTGYHPVNMGLNVGDGLGFMLKNVRPWLRRGDVVVISPEYEHYGDFFNGRGDFLYAEIEHRPSMIKSLTAANYLEVLNKGYIIAGSILRYTVDRRGRLMREMLMDKDNPYSRAAFNRYGDLEGRTRQPSFMKTVSNLPGPANSHVTEETISRAVKRLNEFNEECKKIGVQVFYSFPPVPREIFEKHGEVIREIAQALERNLQFPILDSPEEMSFPLEDFYDGVYHLTDKGSTERTSRLIKSLREKGIERRQSQDNYLP